jgi:streptomycin 6-kinase
MISVRDVVRNKALAAGAGEWLRDLPGLVAELERDWSISVGRAYDDPTEAFVAEATLADGAPAVLKLHIPRPGHLAKNEITVLRLSAGNRTDDKTDTNGAHSDGGCVRLLNADVARGALLLERLGRPMSELGLSLRERLEILCAVAAKVWRRAPGCGLPTGADKARSLADAITNTWEELDRPCTERAVAHALACAESRGAAHDDERAVLLHGDVHQWNALESPGGFKLVDPDGLLAEAEYDLGVFMREDPVELMTGDPYERARWLARRTGLNATAIWEWGVTERVATGLALTRIGLQPVGAQMLAAADQIATHP